ncbi:DsbA family protein [Caulobacter sp. NIBR2454]|uniref:DsbA family protein n=1 Tax=Caulobacter sp. NIBR2454 TaxID=3015996 RepID=UPI0022B5E9F9|nr:DsbA family protein [Caulobacter sp. NIBR2454]
MTLSRQSLRPDRRSLLLAGSAFALAGVTPAVAAPVVRADDMVLGNPKAKVTVVEYASASCPHCAHFANEDFPQFKKAYIDTGKVRFVLRELLTPPQNFAALGFLTARCAGRDKYFDVLAAVFRDQAEIYRTSDLRGGLLKIAQGAGLTETQLNACINQNALDAMQTRINADATADGVDQSPTFFVNGVKLGGTVDFTALKAAVDKALKG